MEYQRAHHLLVLDGIVAKADYEPTIENCYYDLEKLDQNMIIENIDGMNHKGISTTADEMKSEEIYNKLNEDGVWEHQEGEYPKLLDMPVEESMYEEIQNNGIIYRINYNNNTAQIIGRIDDEHLSEIFGITLEIPEKVENDGRSFTIRSIGNNAFEGLQIPKVSLPSTINKIADGAFKNCENLSCLTLPERLTKIGNNVFENCAKLEYVYIPAGVTTIGTDILKKSEEAVIYGYKDSYANTYATDNKIKFVAIDDAEGKGDIAVGGLIYKLDKENKTAAVVGMKNEEILTALGYDRELIIPSKIEVDGVSYIVREIEEKACENPPFLYVVIPKSISKLDITAFGTKHGVTINIDKDNMYLSYENGMLYNRDQTILYGCMERIRAMRVRLPEGVVEIKENAFNYVGTKLSEIFIYPKVTTIHESAFHNIKDNVTIFGYAGSYAEEYAKKNNIKFECIGIFQEGINDEITPFEWERDNYNFINSATFFDSYDIGGLKQYLSNSLREYAEKTENEGWAGSCGGIAQTAILFKYGYLTPSYWQTDNMEKQNYIYSLENVSTNTRLKWVINFYYTFWYSITESSFSKLNEFKTTKIDGFYDGVKRYYNSSKKSDILLCSFFWIKEDGNTTGHAIVITGEPEELDENFYNTHSEDFKKYKYRIPIYDVNSLVERFIYIESDFSDLTFGTENEVGYYFSENADDEGKVNKLESINAYALKHDSVFSVEEMIHSKDIYQFNCFEVIRYNSDTSIKVTNLSGEFVLVERMENKGGNLDCTIQPEIGATAEGDGKITHNNIIFKDGDWYSFETLNDTDPLEASMLFGDSYMTAKTIAGGKAIFENKKSVTLSNPSGKEYEISLTLNDEFMTLPWYTITATGTDAKDIKLEMVPEGVIVSGDNLKNLVVKGNNTEETVELNINTDKNKVLITANNDETKLIAFIDTDGDGTFETPLDSNQIEDDNKGNEENKNNNENNKDNNENNNESNNKNQEKEENNKQQSENDSSNDNVKTGDTILYAIIALLVSISAIAATIIIKYLFK